MKILGFRADPKGPRYAIVEMSGSQFTLLNAASESKLVFPANCDDDAAQVTWLYREFERIFHAHPDIAKVVIKKGEFTQGDNNAKRLVSYQEAVLLLFCGIHNKQIITKLYTSLGTNNGQVKEHAIARVDKTKKYWDTKMADAVIAAWWGGCNP